MMKRLKGLNDTIAEIETEIKKKPNLFLISTLKRLKLCRDYDLDNIVEKIARVHDEKQEARNSGFKGYGIP
jgi:hypothetical protein